MNFLTFLLSNYEEIKPQKIPAWLFIINEDHKPNPYFYGGGIYHNIDPDFITNKFFLRYNNQDKMWRPCLFPRADIHTRWIRNNQARWLLGSTFFESWITEAEGRAMWLNYLLKHYPMPVSEKQNSFYTINKNWKDYLNYKTPFNLQIHYHLLAMWIVLFCWYKFYLFDIKEVGYIYREKLSREKVLWNYWPRIHMVRKIRQKDIDMGTTYWREENGLNEMLLNRGHFEND